MTSARGSCKWSDKTCCASYDGNDAWKRKDGGTYKNRRTYRVKDGECIQQAIDKAACGDRILVGPGTYDEQITITKDGIQLIGNNAIIVPPSKPVKNACSGLAGPNTEAGICVAGSKITIDDFIVEHRKVRKVGKPVKDVSISGFQVQKFSGINIAILGAKNAVVSDNTLTDGASYGCLSAGSSSTLIERNVVSSTKQTFIGICMDNFEDVFAFKNKISKQIIGFCVQTPYAVIQHNEVSDCCFGAFVDPGVKGAKLQYNHFGPVSKTGCEAVAAGVFLDGPIDTKIVDNVIDGIANGGTGAGVVVVDDPCNQTGSDRSLSCIVLGHPAVAKGNIIVRNTISNNDVDIFYNTTGTGNVIKCNTCSTSFPPPNLCAK